MTHPITRGVVGAVLLGGLAYLPAAAPADNDAPPTDGPVTVVDAAGKEVQLAKAKLTAGTRRLAWLAGAEGTSEDARKGPLALAVREPNSTTYEKGVVTLVPVGTVEAVRYEYDKQLMTVAVKGLPDPIVGTLQFQKINVVGLEGDVGGAVTKYTGGVAKDGFRSVTFPAAKPPPTRPPGGTVWAVQIDQLKAGNPVLVVRNVKALYQFSNGTEQLVDSLPTRKGEPLALNQTLKKLEVVAVDPNTRTAVFEVATEGGADRLVAVPFALERDRRIGTLTGLVGEVDCGWKLFPLHTIKGLKPADGK